MLATIRAGLRTQQRVPLGLVNAGVFTEPKRHASDKVLKMRMVAVTNIKKITKAMKMVASAKLRRAEDALNSARNFSKGLDGMFPVRPVEELGAKSLPAAPAAEGQKSTGQFLVVAVTPDRGLCGSVNGSIVRGTRARCNHHVKNGKSITIIGLGEKTRAGLERNFAKELNTTIGEHSKLKRRTFKQSLILTDLLLRTPFDQGEIVYNYFQNLMSFQTRTVAIDSLASAISDPKTFEAYDFEGNSDVLENFFEFTTALRLHSILAETDMVEFSQRVNSMTNSSKNAEEMLSNLRLQYNRVRQSRVTTELVEIISGATAAAEQV